MGRGTPKNYCLKSHLTQRKNTKENLNEAKDFKIIHIGDDQPRDSVNNFKLNEVLNRQLKNNSLLQPFKKIPLKVKKEQRKSKTEQINRLKTILMSKLGNKYNLLLSYSKRFILSCGEEK